MHLRLKHTMKTGVVGSVRTRSIVDFDVLSSNWSGTAKNENQRQAGAHTPREMKYSPGKHPVPAKVHFTIGHSCSGSVVAPGKEYTTEMMRHR
jgi:hypothetical protein